MVDYFGPTVNGRFLQLSIQHAQDVAGNFSQVRTIMYVHNGAGSVSDSAMQVGLAVGGVQAYWWQGQATYPPGVLVLADVTRNIAHDSSGNASVTFQGAVYGAGAGFINLVVNVFNLTLPTIPRATTPNWSGNFIAGDAKTINLPRANAGFTHEVAYAFGTASGTIATGAGVTASWTPPSSLLEQIPNTGTGTGAIHVTTKQGATVIGTTSRQFTLEAGPGVVPTISAVLWDDANTTVKANIGAFVQGLSLVKGAVTAAGVYGSTITERRLRLGPSLIQENTPFVIAGSGTVAATGEAVDSRGRVGSANANFGVLPYTVPTIGSGGWQVRRADAANAPTDTGEYLRIDLHAIAAALTVAAVEKNALTVKVRTKPVGGAWTNRNTITPGLIQNGAFLVSGGAVFLVTTSYEVEITLSDKTGVEPTRLLTTVPTATVTLDLNGTKVAVGKYWEQGALDVGGDIYASGVRVSVEGHTHPASAIASGTIAPARLPTSTDTAIGAVELATQAEVNAATDAARAVTPATLRGRAYAGYAEAAGVAWSNSGYATVVYPVGRFSVPPILNTTIQSTSSNQVSVPWFNAQTASSFNVAVFTIGGAITTGNVSWHAIQMTAGAAAG